MDVAGRNRAGTIGVALLAAGALILLGLVVLLLVRPGTSDDDAGDEPDPPASESPPPHSLRPSPRPAPKPAPRLPPKPAPPPAVAVEPKAQPPSSADGGETLSIEHLRRAVRRAEVGMAAVRRRIAGVIEQRPEKQKAMLDELNLELRKLEAKRLELRRQLRVRGAR